MKTNHAIAVYWAERPELVHEASISIDLGEPSCWACGEHWEGRYDAVERRRRGQEWPYDAAPLQRCHILAKGLGGDPEPENIFLMCVPCHDLAPNTTSRQLFLTWARAQSAWRRGSQELAEAFVAFGLDIADELLAGDFRTTIRSQVFSDWCAVQTMSHWGQRHGGSRLTISSVVAAYILYREMIHEQIANSRARIQLQLR